MSINCVGCQNDIYKPDIVWYAGTKFSYTVNYICGTCVSLIPPQERTLISELQPFSVTFGHLHSETDIFGSRYQSYGSERGKVIFKTSTKAIIENIPYGESFLDQLYPFCCIEEYITEIMRNYKETKATDPLARENLMEDIKAYWLPIAACLSVNVVEEMDYRKLEKEGNVAFAKNLKIPEQEIAEVVRVLEREYKG